MLISRLPREIIEEILVQCDPLEVAKFAQTCRTLRVVIYNPEDSALWRSLYLAQPLDDLRLCVSPQGIQKSSSVDWKSDLQRIIRARTVVNDISLCRPGELPTILQTLVDMTCYIPPLTTFDNPAEISLTLLWVAAVLRHGFLDQAALLDMSDEGRQLHARLHTYFGVTRADTKAQARVRSRAMVYDMRNYRWDNEFGPFDGQGNVNWLHVQALHHNVSMHLVDLGEDEEFEFALFPMSLPFTQVTIPRGVKLDEEVDWAGLGGTWTVSFCFCDHRELLLYNASETNEEDELDTSLFEGGDFREVYRSLQVNLEVTRTEPNPAHPNRPKLFFVGAMAPPSTSTISGSVQLRTDNQIQWHFISGEQGNAIWSSEGLQVGGVRSAYGVLGAWTTIFHEADDPVGPFWLRKCNEIS